MRVRFTGPNLEPIHVLMDLDQIPRVGDYVNLDIDRPADQGGILRHVASVRWDLAPRRWSDKLFRWVPAHPRKSPWFVHIETDYGRPR